MLALRLVLILAFTLGLSACDDAPASVDASSLSFASHDHDHALLGQVALDADGLEPTLLPDGLSLDAGPFVAAALRLDVEGDPALEHRVWRQASGWSPWTPTDVSWREGDLMNARVSLETPAQRLALRVAQGHGRLRFLFAELHDAPLPLRRALETPGVPSRAPRTLSLALAPAEVVHPRADWSARAAACQGEPHTPSSITIHHTATPNNDATSPEARLRQIQAFHIDTRGWCDIGYHFLVSQDGQVWQGRETELRTGAHVKSHNTGNIGVTLLGNYEEVETPDVMIEGAARVLSWLSEAYDIDLDRAHVLGHQEWPSAATACPGRFLSPRLNELLTLASSTPVDDPGDDPSDDPIEPTEPTITTPRLPGCQAAPVTPSAPAGPLSLFVVAALVVGWSARRRSLQLARVGEAAGHRRGRGHRG